MLSRTGYKAGCMHGAMVPLCSVYIIIMNDPTRDLLEIEIWNYQGTNFKLYLPLCGMD